jgi:hypothetical protein
VSQRISVSAIRYRQRLSCRLPPRLSRSRTVRPDEAGMASRSLPQECPRRVAVCRRCKMSQSTGLGLAPSPVWRS